jgi:hypothetical protein
VRTFGVQIEVAWVHENLEKDCVGQEENAGKKMLTEEHISGVTIDSA